MSIPRILIVGRHPPIMARVTALLAGAGYVALGALTDDEARAQIASGAPDALLVGGGVEPAARAAIIRAFAAAHPDKPIIEHAGGPHGLVEALRARLGAPR